MAINSPRKVTQQISNVLRVLTSILLFSIANPSFADDGLDEEGYSLTPFKATYRAFYGKSNVGEAQLYLQDIGEDNYSLRYDAKVSKFFLSDKRFEESIFHFDGAALTPQRYEFKRSGTGSNKSLSVVFDALQNQIHITGDSRDNDDKNAIVMPWQGETDNQLYRLDLPIQLSKGKTEFDYQFINYRGQLKTYRMKVLGTEQLELPYGMLEGIKVKIMRKTNKRETFAWFSPELNFTMVRLQQFKNGKEQGDIRLLEYEVLSDDGGSSSHLNAAD